MSNFRVLQNPARQLPVLELMYLCLSLGFMGRYRLSPRGPAEIDKLREEVYAAIATVRPRTNADLSAYENYLSRQLPVVWQPTQAQYLWEVKDDLRGVAPVNVLQSNGPEYYYFVK